MLVIPSSAEMIFLRYVTDNDVPQDLIMRLFANDLKPSKSTGRSDVEEVFGGGYSPKELEAFRWSFMNGNPSVAQYPEVVWAFDSPVGKVFGYYLTRTDGSLLWLERFHNGPYEIDTRGDKIKVSPKISLGQRNA